jgi:tetratricopeptide (TPR) repeat protein
VNKEKFHLLIQNFACLEQEEADELIRLQKEYPYSQVVHNLVAKAAHDLNLSDKDQYLHESAIYSTDRSVLKSIITSLKTERVTPPIKVVEEKNPEYQPPFAIHSGKEPIAKESVATESLADVKAEVSVNGEDIYTQVTRDLANLNESRHRFEEVVDALEKNKPIPLASIPKKSVEQEIKRVEPSDELIEEIKNSKKKIKPDGPKQKEQIEIIDQFIKTQPTISKPKTMVSTTEDLTEKVDIYGENIVSETLVEILLKQGKKEKAIEMLKKLIWKFPQKKAYFAAQIEELKK